MPDNKDKVAILHETVSKDYDIGTLDEFKKKLSIPEKRKAFYEGVGVEYSLGSFDEFEAKVAPVKKKDSPYSTKLEQPYSNLGMPYASGDKNKSISEKFVASQQKNVKTNQYDARQTANRTDPMAYLKTDATKFGAKVEDVFAKANEASQKGTANDFQKQLLATNAEKELKFSESNNDSYTQKAMDALGSGMMSTMDMLAIGGLHAADAIIPTGEYGKNETINKAISAIKDANKKTSEQQGNYNQTLAYGGSPTEAFYNGDWEYVAKLTGLKVLNTIPTSVAIGANPAIATAWAMGNVSNEYSKLIEQGYAPTQAATDATISTTTEFVVDRLFGGAKQLNNLFKTGGKEAVKKAIYKEVGKSIAENIGGEQVENFINNLSKYAVLGNKKQDLFEGAGDTFFTSLGMSSALAPAIAINTAKNNLIAKQQENAIQEPSTGEVLQRQQGEVSQNGSESTGVEQSQQDPSDETIVGVINEVVNNPEIQTTDTQGNPIQITGVSENGIETNAGIATPDDIVISKEGEQPITIGQAIELEHEGQQQQEAVTVLNQELEQQGLTTEGKIVAIDDANNNVTFEDGSNIPMENVNIINVNTGQKVTSLPEYLQQPTQPQQQQEQYAKEDIKVISNFGALFGANTQSKRVDILSKINNPTVKEIFHNFDSIIEQLGYTKSPDADC